MRRFVLAAMTAALVLAVALPASAAQRPRDRLDVYTAVLNAEQLSALAAHGFELNGTREVEGGTEVQFAATKAQRAKLARSGSGPSSPASRAA
jgi:hypothetical protein